jgi:hypothetical protein
MPNQSHTPIVGDPWHRCDICNQDNRTSRLRRQPGLRRGLLVCPKCWDDPLTFNRDYLIQETLAQSADQEMQVADILQQPVNENDNERG